MCRKFLLVCLILSTLYFQAGATQYAYQVNFRDKNGTKPFSDSTTFLSSRSLARRAAQGIVLDSTDLPVTKAYIDSVLALTSGKLHCTSKWFNLCVILISDSAQIHALDGIAFVTSKKLVGYYSGILHKTTGTTATTGNTTAQKTTATDAVYYNQTWQQTNLVNGQYLHNQGYKGAGKIIAVVDAGFSGTNTHSGFDSLRSSGRIIDVHNFTLASNNVYAYDNHGTEVLSTMAGYVPDTFVGSAPLASYALYVTEDNNSEQPIELLNMLAATEHADSIGVDIISSSLGYNSFTDPADDLTFAQLDGKTTIAAKAANMATRKGMLFVTSAGNEGGSSWNRILTPGDADSAITVGNVDIFGVNAGNSGYGPNAAGRVKPDVCTLGQPGSVFFSTGGYFAVNGTSISTPQIAGWAACLWQAVPNATPGQIRRAIVSCANHYSTPGTQIGFGIPDFRCSAYQLNIDTPLPPTIAFSIITANPIKNSLDITVTLKVAQEVNFKLFDAAGKEIVKFSKYFYAGENQPLSYNVANLPCGNYLLKAVAGAQQQVVKLVKQ